ncbi:MAG: hypothetical protein GY797_39930, partial [Deltaproteobacteria bacterium]|nr:hypothetical protein [Deltaproteobacteria bacterium]
DYAAAGSGADPATVGSDFTATSGTHTFAVASPGSDVVNVPVLGDTSVEGDETFDFTLTLNTGIVSITGTNPEEVTITDDDTYTVSISAVALSPVTEGNAGSTNVGFTLSLANVDPVKGVVGTVSVDYAAAGSGADPATVGSDFTATSGTHTFAVASPGSDVVNVPVLGDTSV